MTDRDPNTNSQDLLVSNLMERIQISNYHNLNAAKSLSFNLEEKV